MSLRLLFSALIALAMLIAPLAVLDGVAMAMSPVQGNHAQAMTGGHCDQQPAKSPAGKSIEKTCCAAMCTAIAGPPSSVGEPLALSAARNKPPVDLFRKDYLAELPTPPPRIA